MHINKTLLAILFLCLLLSSCVNKTYNPTSSTKVNRVNLRKALHREKPNNFLQAKKLANIIFAKHRKSFYCGCDYNISGTVDFKGCGYTPKKDTARSHKIEWEHIVPAKQLGQGRACWSKKICTAANGKKYKGRKCCAKIDNGFRLAESDLHNLVPAIGEVNAARGTKSFGITNNFQAPYGACNIKFDLTTNLIEPDTLIKGQIARVYLYMSDIYGVPISQREKDLFTIWDKQYPPGAWEISWNNEVMQIQGNSNLFIKYN